jgi:hypothetical protein
VIEKSRLEELSAALPEKERRELLERISRRMEREESDEAVPVELQEDEREKIISYELRRAGWWVHFLVWLRTFLSGRKPRDVYLGIRLRMLRARIRSVNPNLTGFDTRDLTPRFARRVYDLYLRLQPLAPFYRALSADKAVRGATFTFLLEQRSPEAKKTVEQLVSDAEMEEIFAQTGQTDEIRKKLGMRLAEYVRGVPESLVLQLEEQCRVHLALARLASYPFASLFRYFNFLLPDSADAKYPSLEHAPAMLTLDLLEKLHAAVMNLLRSGPEYLYAEEPAAFYLMSHAGLQPSEEGDYAKVGADLTRMRAEVTALGSEAEAFAAQVPLLDLIRYFRRDPWYQLLFNPPRLYLRNLYSATLKLRIGQELEEKLGTIRERVISRKVQELLKGGRTVEFSWYKETPDFDFRKLGLPFFTHFRSLSLAYNYILQQYKGTIQEAAQIVANTALAANRITQTRLQQCTSGLEDLEARIVLFDRSLSMDEDDGKQLVRYRYGVGTDLVLQKSYRGFVSQKDKEARDLVDKAKEHLAGIRRVFDEIRTSTFDSTRSLLKVLHSYRGKTQTLGQILNARSEGIGAALKLVDQVLEVEKGA